jgi:hypothetical protein
MDNSFEVFFRQRRKLFIIPLRIVVAVLQWIVECGEIVIFWSVTSKPNIFFVVFLLFLCFGVFSFLLFF